MPDQAEKSTYYNPKQTDEVRKSAIRKAIQSQRQLLRATERIDISDLSALQEKAQLYMSSCEAAGVLPNLEGLASICGFSRQWLYEYLREHHDAVSARFIDSLRLAWSSLRISLAESKNLDPAVSIFILKNSGLGFSDRQEIEFSQASPYRSVSDDELKQKYLSDVVEGEA